MRLVADLAAAIERASHQRTRLGAVARLVFRETLSDRLWAPLKGAIMQSTYSLVGLLVIYLLICIVYTPLWLCSFAITSLGSVLLLLYLIVLLCRCIARTMSYPGSTASFQRDLSTDFMRRLATQLENTGTMMSNFSATVMLMQSGRIPRVESRMIGEKVGEIETIVAVLPRIRAWTQRSLDVLASRGEMTQDEIQASNRLNRAIADAQTVLVDLCPLVLASLTQTAGKGASESKAAGSPSTPSSSSGGTGSGKVNANDDSLVGVAGRALQICEELKAAAVAMKPPKPDEDGPLAMAKGLWKINVGPEGAAKLSMQIMREQLKANYGAQSFTLAQRSEPATGVYGRGVAAIASAMETRCGIHIPSLKKKEGIIDGVYVPSRRRWELIQEELDQQADSASGSPTGSPPLDLSDMDALLSQLSPQCREPSPLGTVLFACPNAGMYEGLGQADQDASWIGFYTNLGFDYCVFNYRGYGLTSGVPTPEGIKADGEVVVDYLRKEKKITRLIIHGESIGGMTASHIARHCGADMLVCDRTFASLDSTAARLLGGWASLGLRYIGQWNTNVAHDFLHVRCPKVVLQDPADEIIANASSLKNGVATHRVLGDSVWTIRSLPRQYAIASYDNAPVPAPPGFTTQELLLHANTSSEPLKEEFIVHLFACLLDVNKRVAAKAQTKKMRAANGICLSPQMGQGDIESGLGDDSLGDLSMSEDSADHFDTSGESHFRSSGASAADDALMALLGSDDSFGAVSLMEEKAGAGKGMQAYLQGAARRRPGGGAGWLADFCGKNIQDARSGLGAVEKVWICAARVDGGSGQLLGQALSGGVDGLRCWVCSHIVWSARASHDTVLPLRRTSIGTAINELGFLMDAGHPTELRNDDAVVFIKAAFEALAKRTADCSREAARTFLYALPSSDAPSSSLITSSSSSSSTSAYLSQYLPSFLNLSDACATGQERDVEAGRGEMRVLPEMRVDRNIFPPHGDDGNEMGDSVCVGRVVPLHTGHNGWPTQADLDTLTALITAAGFDARINREGAVDDDEDRSQTRTHTHASARGAQKGKRRKK